MKSISVFTSAFVFILLVLGGVFGAQNALANELGGVSFKWTYISAGSPFKGRFTNRNQTCKLVRWYAMSSDGRAALSPSGESRIEGNNTLDVQISNQAGSADVIIQGVREC